MERMAILARARDKTKTGRQDILVIQRSRGQPREYQAAFLTSANTLEFLKRMLSRAVRGVALPCFIVHARRFRAQRVLIRLWTTDSSLFTSPATTYK